MDKEDIILAKILRAAKEGTLSKRNWLKYGCKSEEEMQTFLDGLLSANAIIRHIRHHSAATGGRGSRELITWENDPYYSITSQGKEDLERLEGR